MSTQTIEVPDDVVERAKALTGKKSARAALVALVDGAGSVPDAKTRAYRAKNVNKTTVVRGGKAAAAFAKKLLRG
jgi:hypothetical protein